MGWLFILTAAIFEVIGAIGLKLYSQRKSLFRLMLYWGGFFVSFTLFYFSLHYLDLSIVYPVWVGLGTSGAVLANMFIFNEPKNLQRLSGLAFIIVGIVGLHVTL
ncbi:multidrug efflux SMR transporter [Gilliamella sp. B2776]|uniref:DMT family transporter n=1 Tax=unclassified Gilliamella TaxID=2685620 RepID=UPI002269B026|nr:MULTISPECIES: multidrug efflux SMR transporter [unclassified Gilliamella]MCX8650005.1 multidrug efflux SMR transporter [Gilliamella sp. B2779]MCX8654938.1 multidrug efflux SMR transporter [Gilliamella sp. B2737]MCX8656581.1 multidrug efflux SMR transporter [Gilliamella sp. B2894]MCX8665373.1 multidrug efflux SMR transporter [Gilliamella sp. B2887]MCX8691778.1 multidrug efflux SMR transporter [Gilliamella sp. B2776]